MTEQEFQKKADKIKQGDNSPLKWVFEQCGDYCIRYLRSKTNCQAADAYDILVDAVMNFRDKVLSGKLTYITDIRYYMTSTCWRMWLKRYKKRKGELERRSDVQRYYYDSRYSEEEYDTMVQAENAEAQMAEKKQSIDATMEALKTLGEKCEKILKMFYLEKKSMVDIAQIMQFSNANVAKTSKSRCYKKWRAAIKL